MELSIRTQLLADDWLAGLAGVLLHECRRRDVVPLLLEDDEVGDVGEGRWVAGIS
jgi:hypothetical protein